MICPKCGTEIQDGYLYCSKCGEEINMVPDFEVELEEGIEQTISEVAEIIADSVVETAEEDKISVRDSARKDKDKFKKYIGPGLLVGVAVILGLLFVFGIYRLVAYFESYYSFDTQYAKAKTEYESGDFEDAVKTARHVISLNGKDKGARLLLADSYYELKKYDESIAVLNDLLNEFPQDKSIYERLIAQYELDTLKPSSVRHTNFFS